MQNEWKAVVSRGWISDTPPAVAAVLEADRVADAARLQHQIRPLGVIEFRGEGTAGGTTLLYQSLFSEGLESGMGFTSRALASVEKLLAGLGTEAHALNLIWVNRNATIPPEWDRAPAGSAEAPSVLEGVHGWLQAVTASMQTMGLPAFCEWVWLRCERRSPPRPKTLGEQFAASMN